MRYKVLIVNLDNNRDMDWNTELISLYPVLSSHISSNFPCNFSIDCHKIGQLMVYVDDLQYNRYKLTTPIEEQFDLTTIDWLHTSLQLENDLGINGFYIETIIEWELTWYPITDS